MGISKFAVGLKRFCESNSAILFLSSKGDI